MGAMRGSASLVRARPRTTLTTETAEPMPSRVTLAAVLGGIQRWAYIVKRRTKLRESFLHALYAASIESPPRFRTTES